MKRILALFVALLAPPLLLTAQTSHKVVLTWSYTQGSDAATGFYVFREASGATTYTQLNATAIPVGTLTYTDSTVSASTTYLYYVTAVDANGNQSAPSNTYTAAVPGNPAAPTSLTGSVQ